MSEGFHVHGAHEHIIEEQAHHGPGLSQQIAIFTALLSAAGAVISYQGSTSQYEAIQAKNEALLQESLAMDQWNEYQAASNKAHLMQVAADLVAANQRASYLDQAQKYSEEKKAIRDKAQVFEKQATAANQESERMTHPHHRLQQAITLLQIAIALASVTALTRVRWLFVLSGLAAIGTTGLWITALLM